MPHYGFDGCPTGNEWVKTSLGWKKLVALRENLHRHIKKIARERFQTANKDLSCGEGTSAGTSRQGTSREGKDGEDVTAGGQGPDTVATGTKAQGITLQHEYVIRDQPLATYILLPRAVGARRVYFTIGEVICKLDFAGAVRDHRRFNYVCKILELIITGTQFSSLSGLAQRNLLFIIEEVLHVVLQSQQYMAQLRRLLCAAIVAMNSSRNNHIGCPATWKNRMDMLERWLGRLNSMQLKEREEDGQLMLTDLPDEVLRRILHYLGDGRDVVSVGRTCYQLHLLASSNLLWRDLCSFHFTQNQVTKVWQGDELATDWKAVYQKVHRRHPLREVYTDTLQICGLCNCLFWTNGGHPCTKELLPEAGDTFLKERPELATNIHLTPQKFLALFSSPH